MNMAVFWHFFCFRRSAGLPGTDLWITTRSMEWRPLEDHSFFCERLCCKRARNAHEGFDRISGWIKIASVYGEKERWNEK